MEKRKIASLEVSVVGLGCNNFGGRLDEEGTRDVVDAALDKGINLFDTADIYGKTKSEEFLGRILKGRRDRVVLATKFGMEVDENRKGARPEYVRQAAEDSLRRLQTDHIDLYQLHQPDPSVPLAETLGAMNELVQAGKVREIGCSNFSAEQLEDAERISLHSHRARFVSVQNEFSLLKREAEREVLPACKRLGLAFLPYFPLASGLLTGKYRVGKPLPEGTRIQEGSRWLQEYDLNEVEALIGFAESRGRTILELAFSWLLAHEPVASVIAGATKRSQIKGNVRAAGWKLSEEDMRKVGALLKGERVGA